MSNPLKHASATITDGRDRAPARSMFKAIGFNDEDLAKPIIGIANTWIETMPCNFTLRDLAVKVKEGVRAAGGTPMEFNTIVYEGEGPIATITLNRRDDGNMSTAELCEEVRD